MCFGCEPSLLANFRVLGTGRTNSTGKAGPPETKTPPRICFACHLTMMLRGVVWWRPSLPGPRFLGSPEPGDPGRYGPRPLLLSVIALPHTCCNITSLLDESQCCMYHSELSQRWSSTSSTAQGRACADLPAVRRAAGGLLVRRVRQVKTPRQ